MVAVELYSFLAKKIDSAARRIPTAIPARIIALRLRRIRTTSRSSMSEGAWDLKLGVLDLSNVCPLSKVRFDDIIGAFLSYHLLIAVTKIGMLPSLFV
jgi:hypothetical protein